MANHQHTYQVWPLLVPMQSWTVGQVPTSQWPRPRRALPELDGTGQMAVPQAYPQHTFVPQTVDAHMLPAQNDRSANDGSSNGRCNQWILLSPIPRSEMSATPAVAPAAPAAEAPVAYAVPAGIPDAAATQPLPSSPSTVKSVTESLARVREEERALEERKKLLLELQEVEQKRQEAEQKKRELSDRLAGLEGRQ